MADVIVGYTGFVGSNLVDKHKFDGLYNSKNIKDAFGANPDLLVYSGVPSAMFLANNFPQKDLAVIEDAMENIKKINPRTIVLISTIAVYSNPIDINEDSLIDINELTAYGKNRLLHEKYVEENFENHLIVRLPALFGKNLKKNFIYDFIHLIPALLTQVKFEELTSQDNTINAYYEKQDNGFYKCKELDESEKEILKKYFKNIGFSALNFTDSRSIYQFYNLENLWEHIEKSLKLGIKKLNLATEPISVAEVYKALTGEEFINELNKTPFNYNYKTVHAEKLNGENGYLYSKKAVIEQIKNFVQKQNCNIGG